MEWNLFIGNEHCTKKKFSVKDFFRKCDQIRSFLRIWSDLLKSLMVNLIFLCNRSKMKDMKEDSK